MSQYDMLTILMSEPDRWFSLEELSEISGNTPASVRHSLRTLLNHGEIEINYIRTGDKLRHSNIKRLKRHVRISPWYYELWCKEKDKL